MKYNETKIRVRYGETDQMGVVYHANYVKYFEIGRTEWLRCYGITYKETEEKGIIMPVISLQVNYKKSAVYDEVIQVKTSLLRLPKASIEFAYEITNIAGDILATGSTILAFVDADKNRPTRCPKFLLEAIA